MCVSVVIVSPQLTWPALAGGNSLAIWRWRRLLAADGNLFAPIHTTGPSVVVKATARVLLMPVTPSTYGFGAHRHLPCIPTSLSSATASALGDNHVLAAARRAILTRRIARRQYSKRGTDEANRLATDQCPRSVCRRCRLRLIPRLPLVTRTRSDEAPIAARPGPLVATVSRRKPRRHSRTNAEAHLPARRRFPAALQVDRHGVAPILTACHAEGRGFESLQPLLEKPC